MHHMQNIMKAHVEIVELSNKNKPQERCLPGSLTAFHILWK